MLRAAQPGSLTQEPAAVQPAPDPLPGDKKADSNGIRITVLSQESNKAIPVFRIIAGVRASPSEGGQYEKRTGRVVINWQPHTVRIGKDGEYVWPAERGWEETAYRVEADGYVPQALYGIKKANGNQHLVFRLVEDKEQAGRVLSPDGKPVAGAVIALALAQKNAVLENGRLRWADQPVANRPSDRWRRPVIVRTGADGRFRLPTETEPAAILVIHEEGVRELAYDAWQKSPEIRLLRWGRSRGGSCGKINPALVRKSPFMFTATIMVIPA